MVFGILFLTLALIGLVAFTQVPEKNILKIAEKLF